MQQTTISKSSLAWDKPAAVAGVNSLAFSCVAHVAGVLFSMSRAIKLAILAEYGYQRMASHHAGCRAGAGYGD